MSIISIHIGDTADWIGSYIWNIRDESTKEIDSCANIYYDESDQEQLEKPKCVLLDSGDWNSSIHEKVDDLDCVWDGNTDIVQQDYKSNSLRQWSNARKNRFSPKSFSSFTANLPPGGSWFYKRKEMSFGNFSMADEEEQLYDNIRHFAEISDRVVGFDMFVDLYGDFGWVTQRTLEHIRDDYGNNVSIPLWLLDHSQQQSWLKNDTDSNLAPIQSQLLSQLSLPLSYTEFIEHANVIIPFRVPYLHKQYDKQSKLFNLQQYAAKSATILETAMSYRYIDHASNQPTDDLSSLEQGYRTASWIFQSTYQHTLPIVQCEYFMSDDITELSPSIPFDETIFNSLNKFSSLKNARSINPYMKSCSSVLDISTSLPQVHSRSFSNSIVLRGVELKSDFVDKHFRTCFDSSGYYVSRCEQYSQTVNFAINSGIWPVANDANVSFSNSQNIIQQHCACAIGTTSAIHDHLNDVAEKWKTRGNAVKAQLQKVGLQADELEEKYELLISLADRYTA